MQPGESSKGQMFTLDDLVCQLGNENAPAYPVLAYPKSEQGLTDYEFFSGQDINRLVDGAAKSLLHTGIQAVDDADVVALFGVSDLDYIITLLALSRLGYAVLLLSPRLSTSACVALLNTLNANTFLYHPQYEATAREVQRTRPMKIDHIRARKEYDLPTSQLGPPFRRTNVHGPTENTKPCILLHSSGSSGIPKPLTYTHKRLMNALSHARNYTIFLSVPVYHAYGMASLFHGFSQRKTVYVFNGHMPQTHETLTASFEAARPEQFCTVPYSLKLLAEKQDGIDALKHCKLVACAGARCPDELGDMLVEQDVRLGASFGSTEAGFLFSALDRPVDDRAWNYLSAPPHVAPYIYWKDVGGDLYECVILDGFPGKIVSNSNEPPNSFHSADLFTPHPTLKGRWKFVGRLDDRVTLLNGEKVLPLEIEGRIRQDPLVKEAVVFGIDRALPGLLLWRSNTADGLSDAEFLDNVWPAVEDANSRAEKFSQISKAVTVVLSPESTCPITDKASIKRAQVYRDYASVIDVVYAKLEENAGGDLQLNVRELEQWILDTFKEVLNIHLESSETDFFSAGVDSLKAIQMRGLIVRAIDLGHNVKQCGAMVVAECGNAARLASFLYGLRVERHEKGIEDQLETMQALIDKYSRFEAHLPINTAKTEKATVLLTGATGSLGAHLLSRLAQLPRVAKIVCLVRATSPQEARTRVCDALEKYKLPVVVSLRCEVLMYPADLSVPSFGLKDEVLHDLRSQITHIIHSAWLVNFSVSLSSFEHPHISGLANLLAFSLSVHSSQPAHLLHCSSVGAALDTPPPAVIQELPIPELAHASPTGYSRSKLVAERIVQAAAEKAGARATVLRIGQIVPPQKLGSRLWNPNEMIPLMVRSSLSIKALPTEIPGGDECSWLPADVLASSITDLAHLSAPTETTSSEAPNSTTVNASDPLRLVYNLVHPRPFSWATDFVPALRACGLEFDSVCWDQWLDKLESSGEDAEQDPGKKLLPFWRGLQQRRQGHTYSHTTRCGIENGNHAHEHRNSATAGSLKQRCRTHIVHGEAVGGELGLSNGTADSGVKDGKSDGLKGHLNDYNGYSTSGVGEATFDTTQSQKDSESLRSAEKVLEGTYVKELVEAWKKAWQ